LSTEVRAFEKTVLQEALDAAGKLQNRYTRYSEASYFLYFLGWTLAVVGRLLRIEGVGEE
jgi:hypothetical protein